MNFADMAIAYGPNGIRCGCGKPAHSNLAPCDGPEAWKPATAMTDEQLDHVRATLHDHLGPDWTQDYIEGSNGEPDYYRVATNTGNVIATVPDWAGSIAMFLVEAHDYVPKLLAEIARLRAENERLRAAQPVIVRPTDSIDADTWSIITSRRQLIDTIRVWLGDIDPELLHHLTHGTTDIPGQIVDDLPGVVDELIDRIKASVCTCDRFAGHHAPTCRTITG